MMRLRRASAIAALCLLTSTATAYAECAWVLWKSTYGAAANGVSYAGTRFPNSIYESRDGCYRAASDVVGPTGPSVLHREGQNVWIVLHSGSEAGVRTTCWPDTVDPREPKGR